MSVDPYTDLPFNFYEPDDVVGSVGPVGSVGLIPRGIAVGSTGSVSPVGYRGEVLDRVRTWLARFILTVHDSDLDLLALWAAHTHLCVETYTTPRLVIDSPIHGAGKTTVMEHLQRLCLRPVQAASLSSPAMLARLLDVELRTILIDEVDRNLNPKREGVEDLIAVLNAGYKRGGTRPVLVPTKDGWNVREMPTFAPVAMAGNAPHLPDDTRSRTIRVLLLPDLEGRVESSDWEEIEIDAADLGEALAQWADEVRDTVRTVRPVLPEGCTGRSKERWSPIRRVAEAAGGHWPSIADDLIRRDLIEAQMDREDGMVSTPPAVTLLRDIHELWPGDDDFTPTSWLVSELILHNPRTWGPDSAYGKALTFQRLGRMLAQGFKVNSSRQGDGPRGYYRQSLAPVWRRMGMAPGIEPTEPTEPVRPTGENR
ncbi:DUF3631 domain-containing protein [Cellulomonas sp. P24]|uniref:DUF3631 domain-containing protein n=1 Tax=Cellulomonas sp. P24 TaxID=2885206 RepID=UPI00216AE18F|nr:DUF3631 domain-containing protein [Cellulomonas sp. P24]MCR6491709.1 DUF3631 domain-containing protein [Cellulomonas sp. P24]